MYKQFLIFLILSLPTEIFSQWQMLNGPYETSEINCLIKHPNGSLFAAGRGYIGDFDVMLYRSDDSGKTWNKLNQTYNVYDVVYCLAAGFQNEIYAGSQRKYYSSTDNGNHWIEKSVSQISSIKSIVFDSLGNMFLAGWSDPAGGIYKSTNHGNYWFRIFNQNIDHLLIDSSNNIFASGVGGIYFSSNSGTDWITRNNGLSATESYKIEKNSYGELFTSQGSGIYKSTNNGINWLLLPNTATMQTTWTLYIDKNDFLYVCEWSTGVYRLKNNANSWELLPLQRSQINCALVDDLNNLYAGTDKALYFYSESDSSWRVGTIYKDLASVSALAMCSDSIIYSSARSRMWKSTNLGATWFYVNDQTIRHIEKGFNDRIFISPPFLFSDNCGDDWETSNLTDDAGIYLHSNNELYTGIRTTIYKSINNGTHWDSLCWIATPPSFYNTGSLAINSSGYIFWVGIGYAGYPFNLWQSRTYRSTNNGNSFEAVYGEKFVYIIKIDHYGNIYQGTSGAGVVRSTDDGNTWNAINNGLTGVTYVRDLIFSPEGILIAATNNGVYRYSEEYNYWIQLSNQGLRSIFINKLCYHNDVLYAGTDAGVARFVGELPVQLISFYALQFDGAIELNWATSTESNNYGFEIQRKSLEGYFVTIGFVGGHGTTTSLNQYTYNDKPLDAGKYFYRLKQIDFNGSFEYSNVIEVEFCLPDKFRLEQNFPNPFNPTTKIRYAIPQDVKREMSNVVSRHASTVQLKVYDVLGNEVVTLVNEEKPAGSYVVEFDAAGLSSGVYYYQLRAGFFVQTNKMILFR